MYFKSQVTVLLSINWSARAAYIDTKAIIFGDWHLGKMEFWDIAIFVFFKAKMVNLGPIDFQLGLPLDINESDGQNKFEIYISKKWGQNG